MNKTEEQKAYNIAFIEEDDALKALWQCMHNSYLSNQKLRFLIDMTTCNDCPYTSADFENFDEFKKVVKEKQPRMVITAGIKEGDKIRNGTVMVTPFMLVDTPNSMDNPFALVDTPNSMDNAVYVLFVSVAYQLVREAVLDAILAGITKDIDTCLCIEVDP